MADGHRFLVNNIPTLASRLNRLSIANVAAFSHSYDLNSRRCRVSFSIPSGIEGLYTRTTFISAVKMR